MFLSKTQKKFAIFFLIMTLVLSCGFGHTVYYEEDNDGDSILAAFVAGCITGLLLASHDDDEETVVYREEVVVEKTPVGRPVLPGVHHR